MEKSVHDFRGKQTSIFRLAKFQPFGLLHALFYRILIFLAIIYGFLLLAAFFYPSLALAAKIFTVVMWILITPQLFAALKALSLTSTKGVVFGKFSEAYSYLESKKKKPVYMVYKVLPYFALAIWIIFFVGMLIWWPA